MSFCYAHDYCQINKGDASEKRVGVREKGFSAMYDQTVTIKRIVILSRRYYCL